MRTARGGAADQRLVRFSHRGSDEQVDAALSVFRRLAAELEASFAICDGGPHARADPARELERYALVRG